MSESRLQNAQARYAAAAHAMQTGVAMRRDKSAEEPKHLRVGVNASMSDHSGLVRLLIQKGVFTELEYAEAIADAMEREVEIYRHAVAKDHDIPVGQVTLL